MKGKKIKNGLGIAGKKDACQKQTAAKPMKDHGDYL